MLKYHRIGMKKLGDLVIYIIPYNGGCYMGSPQSCYLMGSLV